MDLRHLIAGVAFVLVFVVTRRYVEWLIMRWDDDRDDRAWPSERGGWR